MTAGEQLRQRVQADLDRNEVELDAKEQEILDRACALADDVTLLREAIARDGAVVKGSRDQLRPHPAISEVRQHELAIARLLRAIDLDGAGSLSASEKARRAARARWAGHGPGSQRPVSASPERRARPAAV